MRSPNPLVAIGITTLVTVGAVHSGSAQASAPGTSPESTATSLQPPQSDLPSNLSEAAQQDNSSTPAATARVTDPALVPLPYIQAQAERIAPVLGQRERSIDLGLVAQAPDTLPDTSPDTSKVAPEAPAEALPAPAGDETPPSLPPFEVPTVEVAPLETPAVETPATATPAIETPAVETPAAETPATETPATETPAIEIPATETPASPIETPAAEASTAETVSQAESPAVETPADSTLTEPAAETPADNTLTTPPPVETPVDNTLTAPPPDLTAPGAPATETPATETPDTTLPGETSPATAATSSQVDTPDYLNPSPNPLDLPTRPEEVELQGTQPITLRQAVDLAIRNNPQLRQATQQLDEAQAGLEQARAANNPTVSVNAGLTQAGQQSAVPVQTSPTSPPTTEIRSSDAATLNGNLQVNYALFTSGRRSSLIRAAEGQVRTQQLEVERQKNELILQVANAYYDLQQAGAQVRIFQSNVAQAEQSLRDAEALERAGVGTRFDVLQAQVDVANAQQSLTQQLSSFDVSRRNLVQLLNTSNAVDLTASDPIQVAGDWNLSLEQSIVEALKNRAELEQQLIQREVAEQQRRAALAQLGPQVNLQGAFGLNNNLDAGNGFLNNYQIGVGLNLNLYDGGAARAQARAQEINIAQAESQFETVQNQIRFQTEQAYSQLQASASNIQTTALAVTQAAEALRLARLRFQAGVGTQTDVLRQQTVLAQSQVNNLQAILGYNRALATLQRQVSSLPEGFVGDTP